MSGPPCSHVSWSPAPRCTSELGETPGLGQRLVCMDRGFPSPPSCTAACAGDSACAPSHACDHTSGRCVPRVCGSGECPPGSYCTEAKLCAYQECNSGRPCADGFTCSSVDFTCSPTRCSGQAEEECTAAFVCDVNAGVCTRQACSCDGDCRGGGYCFGGACYPTLGHCAGRIVVGRPLTRRAGEIVVAPLLRREPRLGRAIERGDLGSACWWGRTLDV